MEHNKEPKHDYAFKLLVLGDAGSGKTWFVRKFAGEELSVSGIYTPTTEMEFIAKTIVDPETNKKLKLQLWDSRSQRFYPPQNSHWRGVHGILLLVDVTQRESLANIRAWINEIARYTCETTRILIAASKCDLISERKISNEEIQDVIGKLAHEVENKDHDIKFVEVSAKDDYNITHAVNMLAGSVVKLFLERPELVPKESVDTTDNAGKKDKKSCKTM